MNALLSKLGVKENQIITKTTHKAKGKETTDSNELKQVRKQMNNVYVSKCSIVNSATYLQPKFKRDKNNKFLLDNEGSKVVEGYETKSLAGSYILEDNGDGTHTASKLNVYKETYIVDSESLNITKVTNN